MPKKSAGHAAGPLPVNTAVGGIAFSSKIKDLAVRLKPLPQELIVDEMLLAGTY